MSDRTKNTKLLIAELIKSGKGGISLRLRLLAFLFLLLITIVLGFLIILMLVGVFDHGRTESRKLIENELYDFNQDVYADFGKLSCQGIELSELLSKNISNILIKNHINFTELQNHSELINTILDAQIDPMVLSLQSAKSSGIYIVLDTTVNTHAEHAEFSKSGLFFKSTEPNIINSIDADVQILKGPAVIARARGIELMPQWEQEFDLQKYNFYEDVIENARNCNLPLSRLYYWSKRITRREGEEVGLLLAVPIIAADGTVYGICGFEVSSMLFKLAYTPDNSVYPRIFASLSTIHENYVNINNGLIAGNYYMTNHLTAENMSIQEKHHSFSNYTSTDGLDFSGLHQKISFYPSDSVYADKEWVVGIMMPDEELSKAIHSNNTMLFGAVCLLFLFGMLIAIFLSRKYIAPIKKAFDGIKSNNYTEINKTKIIEIDDLFEYLSRHDDKTDKDIVLTSTSKTSLAHSTAAFESFIESIKTLSRAEKAVFDLYIKGHTAKEITEILFLSINTIKTHNKRIYEKLNVSSRKELLIYINMMKEIKPDEWQ